MANTPAPKMPNTVARRLPLGPKLIGLGVVLAVLTKVVGWLPLIGGPISTLLWLGVIVSVVAGAGLMFVNAKRS